MARYCHHAGAQSNLDNNGQRRTYRRGLGRDGGAIVRSDTKVTRRDVVIRYLFHKMD